ncbi:MAG: DNA cytosine methyltransferase [Rhizobiales bacterium]|nr:DNA cytosine methyltransferase [Hyphomicrobiales bacterium]
MLVADLLCGAGGSSTGAQRALDELGLEMELVCLNHWPTAIDTHQRNHPEARHYVQDIATVRPHLIVPEGYLDLLMASPTCTHHSVARGGKPTSDQQRSDPWHIITWLTELRVKRMIIENVWEFCGWGPVNPKTGKPIKERKGEYFHAWIETIKRLGFEPEWRKLNAADYGDATTRQRFILMARSDGRKVSWPMPTHRRRDQIADDLFSGAQPWRPAREIIDWSIKGKSIFNRKKALAPKTLMRIYAGAVKHDWPQPFIVVLRNHMAAQGIDVPLPTIAANGQHIGLAEPVIVSAAHGVGANDPDPHSRRVKSVDDPLGTIHAGGKNFAVAEPVIMNGRKGNQAKPVSTEPVPTLDTKGGVWLAEPLVLSQHNSGAARTSGDPLPTITTGGAGAVKHEGCARPMLIEPFVLSQASGGAARAISLPLPTSTTGGAGGAHALISPYYSNGWQEQSGTAPPCYTDDEPLPPITTKGRFGLVVPVTQSGGGASARNLDTDPVPTMTTAKGGEFAVVMPVTHADDGDRTRDTSEPLPTITGANRGELAFITAQHGERPGQAPRVHSIDDPAPTIAATGHVDLVEPDLAGFDILFRMLEPHELAAAMGFNTEDDTYEFAGTKTEKIKQIGNAVSVRKMKACVGAIMADADPKHRQPAPTEFREAAE